MRFAFAPNGNHAYLGMVIGYVYFLSKRFPYILEVDLSTLNAISVSRSSIYYSKYLNGYTLDTYSTLSVSTDSEAVFFSGWNTTDGIL